MTCESYISPNVQWSQEPSTWFGQTVLTGTIWFIFTQIFSKSVAWTCTIWLYNIITFIFFHAILGDPFNQEYSGITFWEQLTIQLKGSSGMTFYTLFPIVLFLSSIRLTHFNNILFLFNLVSLLIVILPKVIIYIRYYQYNKTKKSKRSRSKPGQN
ncbi:hypothetical protein NEOKW01_0226 [Nematocida sp. AWRm80]|nr:hypothetical protein NEOKW01_0226 [Nematocida sp. AWRm80]